MPKLKRCKVCSEIKRRNKFHDQPSLPDGKAKMCISCHREKSAQNKKVINIAVDGYKKCLGCEESLLIHHFYYNPSCADDLNPYCIPCQRKRSNLKVVLEDRYCIRCGKLYTPKWKNQRYCKRGCTVLIKDK